MLLRWIPGIPDFAISFNIPFDMSDIKIIGSLGDGVNWRWTGPVRACLRWESANLWPTKSSLLCNLLQQGRLLVQAQGNHTYKFLWARGVHTLQASIHPE